MVEAAGKDERGAGVGAAVIIRGEGEKFWSTVSSFRLEFRMERLGNCDYCLLEIDCLLLAIFAILKIDARLSAAEDSNELYILIATGLGSR